MRHQKAGRKLGRTSSHRRALLRNLVTSLLMHERIITTEAKAKELRRIAEQMITLGKREDLHARRQASRTIMDETVLKKLFETLGARFSKRAGGYTRITKLSYRAGDGAPLAAIELLDFALGGFPLAWPVVVVPGLNRRQLQRLLNRWGGAAGQRRR